MCNARPFVAMTISVLASLVCLMAPSTAGAQDGAGGRLVESYGDWARVESPDYPSPTTHVYKLLFDVSTSPASAAQMNPRFNSVARFLNSHADAGVPAENLKAAIVLHAQASNDVLNDEAYRARFGRDNPNAGILRELHEAGVPIILCGQAADALRIPHADVLDFVQSSLSAFSVISRMGAEGYEIISWNTPRIQ